MVTSMHSHEIAMAVPHAQKEEKEDTGLENSSRNTVVDEILVEMVLLLAPFAPVLAEHLWNQLNNSTASVFQRRWKQITAQTESSIKLPIQVNAKTKKIMTIPANASKEETEEKAKQEISQLLQGKEYNLIYVPKKIINFVIK